MSHAISPETLMRYLDDELPVEERAAVEAHVRVCSECARELTLYREMGIEMRRGDLSIDNETVWSGVSHRIAQPVGWALLVAGSLVWIAWGAYAWWSEPEGFLVRVVAGAVVIGLLLLLTGALIDRLIEARTDPYRKILR